MKVTTMSYGQFLVNTPVNFTGTYFANSVDGLEHDSVHRFLKGSRLTPALVREKIGDVIAYSPRGHIIFDDTVLDKSAGRSIEGVVKQYSGNAHHAVNGIGVVTCVYYNPDNGRFYILDYRVHDKARDGKTKLNHVSDMLAQIHWRDIPYSHVLMDTWYATVDLMNQVMDYDKYFVCAVQSNRLFSPDKLYQIPRPKKYSDYIKASDLPWGEPTNAGYHGKLRYLPANRPVQLFRIVVSTDKTEYIVTNDVALKTTDDTRKESAIRWKIEEFHRELKQLTGIEKCQARKNRSQRNHITMCMLAWIQLKTTAWATNQTIYQVKQAPLQTYMTEQWRHPATVFNLG
jgi:SRSO17 transposase